jgi:hypothetical protein
MPQNKGPSLAPAHSVHCGPQHSASSFSCSGASNCNCHQLLPVTGASYSSCSAAAAAATTGGLAAQFCTAHARGEDRGDDLEAMTLVVAALSAILPVNRRSSCNWHQLHATAGGSYNCWRQSRRSHRQSVVVHSILMSERLLLVMFAGGLKCSLKSLFKMIPKKHTKILAGT